MRKEDKKEKRKGKPQVSGEGKWCFVLTHSSFTQFTHPFTQLISQSVTVNDVCSECGHREGNPGMSRQETLCVRTGGSCR